MTPAVRPEALHGLFVTALEGGIGYWSVATRYRWSIPGTDGETDFDGFHAVIEETESDEDTPPVHRIDAACILRPKRASLFARAVVAVAAKRDLSPPDAF